MTDRYAVFGNPLSHTLSPRIHTAFAEQFGEDMRYEAIQAPVDGFEATVRAFIAAGGKGINVTVPFKVQAEAMADESLEAANICGAANCLQFSDGRIVADNFDGIGLVRDIEDNLGVELKGKRVLFAGAGGATRGALGPFLEAGVAEICVANRTVEKARDVVHLLGPRGSLHACGYDEIDHGFDVVLNATSASLSGQCPPVPPIAFEGAALAYEMVYGKGKTPFLKLAEDNGADEIADGVGMLVEQAAEAFLWWRGKRPQTAAIIADLTVPLE